MVGSGVGACQASMWVACSAGRATGGGGRCGGRRRGRRLAKLFARADFVGGHAPHRFGCLVATGVHVIGRVACCSCSPRSRMGLTETGEERAWEMGSTECCSMQSQDQMLGNCVLWSTVWGPVGRSMGHRQQQCLLLSCAFLSGRREAPRRGRSFEASRFARERVRGQVGR